MSQELTAPTKIEADPIGTALIAAGVTSASIEALAKDYGELAARTQPLETPEEYEVVKRAQLSCRDVRTAVTSALKIERDEAVKYQKFVIQEEKRILAQIATTEEPLKKLREDYDNRELLRQQEEARQWMEKMNLRKQAAFDVGYYFNGQAYLLDRENGKAPWVLREDQVAGMAMSDEALYALLEAQAAELKMTREIKAEAEAKAKEEAEALAAEQRKRDEEAQAKLQEIERREKEMAEKERQMTERILRGRNAELTAVGAVEYPDGAIGFGAYTKTQAELVAMSEHDFMVFVAETKNRRMTWDEEQKRINEQQERERIAREEQMKAEAEERGRQAEAARQAQAKAREEEEKARLAQQEADRIAQAGDKGKVEILCDELKHIEIPELDSAMGQHGMARVRKHLDELIKMVESIAKDL